MGASLCAALLATALSSSSSAAEPPQKRATPDYDGRGEESTAGDAALWVPRIVLAPLYLVSEFLIRRPLGAFVSWAERSNFPKAVYDLFTFGADHSAGFAPIGFIDFGFNPSVGAYVFWNDAFAKGNDIALHATTWGADWLAGVVTDRVRLDETKSVTFRFAGVKRPDYRFHGIGPDSRDADRSRYAQDTVDGRVSFDMRLWRSSRIETVSGLKAVWFGNGSYDQELGILNAVSAGKYALPDGFSGGYTSQYNGVRAAFDTRPRGTATQSGFRVEFDGSQGNDLRRSPSAGWLRYGGGIGGFLDLNDHGRVVSASLSTQFVDPLGTEPVPFTELVTIGGDGPMRGFLPGRLLGRSSAVASLRYRWPIWVSLDGAMEASIGNVFDEHLKGFAAKKLRFSAALGIETVGSPDSAFQLLFGIGTETFEQGTSVDSVRLVIGTNRGF
jgi:hypothetical protein